MIECIEQDSGKSSVESLFYNEEGLIMSNKYIQEYIRLKKNYESQEGAPDSVLALYQFADRLVLNESIESKQVLVDVYQLLGLMESAYTLFSSFVDKSDRKQYKKLAQLQGFCESRGDRYALPRPMTEQEKKAQQDRLLHLPRFRYHPDPISTGAFKEGEAEVCPCCETECTVYYSIRPYCVENVENLCPDCIASGRAAEKYKASFVADAEEDGEISKEMIDTLFHRTPGYISWQGEYWLSCCGEYCAYLGTVGTRELKELGIADQVLSEYESRNEFEDVELYLEKDGSLCGYLFQCLHCGKHHLWVDAD